MKHGLQILIVDDEKQSCALIQKLLHDHYPGNEVEAAYTIADALTVLSRLQPDLIFLDVQMQGETGFDLLDTAKIDTNVIFITAHSEYALKAFRYCAIDYILKPIDTEEFELAVEKAIKRIKEKNTSRQQLEILKEFRTKLNTPDKITIPSAEGFMFVPINEIIYCQAIGNYTQFHFISNQKILSSRTLGYYDDILQNHNFFRVHRSYLVNMNQIRMYKKGEGGIAVMNNGDEVEVARGQKDNFLKLLSC